MQLNHMAYIMASLCLLKASTIFVLVPSSITSLISFRSLEVRKTRFQLIYLVSLDAPVLGSMKCNVMHEIIDALLPIPMCMPCKLTLKERQAII